MSKLNYEHVFNTLVEETAKYITKNNLKAMVLGISGGIDSTVVAAISKVICTDKEARFVVGDCEGADRMAQDYLSACGVFFRDITVYHMFKAPRYLTRSCTLTQGGFTSDVERDAAMTEHSDRDIAFIRKGKESSGTAQNILRRWTK